MTKREISAMIDTVYRHCGQKETVIFCDRVMALGFHHAFKAGISFGKDDMVVPHSKKKIVEDTREQVKEFEQQYNDGLITQGEKYNKVVDAWSKCTEKIADEMMKEISAMQPPTEKGAEAQVNSIYMMAHSGARGSPAQMRQLAGMRGLMAKPSGEIIESPIISNFKEGLSVLEYFNSTHGARKGLADTALKTANSGYLTRRLVDVAQDCIITFEDCGTSRGIKVRAIIDAGQVVASLASRILGRTTAEDVRDPRGNDVLVPNGTLLEEPHVERLVNAGVQEIKIRSVLTCETTHGRVRQMLRARSCPRHTGQYGRSGRRDRGAVDRRAGHPAHHADVPHRRRGADLRAVVHRVELRRHRQDQEPERRPQFGRRLDRDGAQPDRCRHRSGRYRTRRAPHPVRRAPQGHRRRAHQARPAHRRVGSVHASDPHRGRGRDRLSRTWSKASRSPKRSTSSTGIAKRVVIDWRSGSARGQQDLRPALVIKGKDGKILKLSRGGDARYMLAVDAIISVDPGATMKRGRRDRAYPDRKRKDPRHHRRSAACRGTVRGAAAEGIRGHRRDFRHRALRHATTRTSAASPSSRPTRVRSRGSISFPRASTSICRMAM